MNAIPLICQIKYSPYPPFNLANEGGVMMWPVKKQYPFPAAGRIIPKESIILEENRYEKQKREIRRRTGHDGAF